MNLRPSSTASPVLRLVGGGAAIVRPSGPIPASDAATQVARENRAASVRADLDPTDPRWVLAARTRTQLQGAALTADRRRHLLALAHDLGMRPFDANMVIAIVQDEARTASARAGATWDLAERLRIIPAPSLPAGRRVPTVGREAAAPSRSLSPAILLLAAAALGVSTIAVLLIWLLL